MILIALLYWTSLFDKTKIINGLARGGPQDFSLVGEGPTFDHLNSKFT